MRRLIDLSASEMAQKIKAKEITSEQLVQAHLDQIKKHNQKINAIVTPFKNAIERAKEADKALADGEDWGPLHGVPITVKDSWATAGVRTTSSFKPLKNYVPEKDAVIVQNVLDAGAIILGKTNLPMLASDIQTNSPIFGRSNNPWDNSRTTGGSTGGGAAAVSGRLSPIELGSDLAGSIRIPSHCCGVIGFKPTEGELSVEGHIPPAPGKPLTVKHQNHAGIIARSVEDIKTVFECVGGSSATTENIKFDQPNVGWYDVFDDAPLNKDTEKVFLAFVEKLEKNLAGFKKVLPEGLDFQEIWETFGHLYGYEAGKGMPWFIRFLYKQEFRKPELALYRGVFKGMGQNEKMYHTFLEKRKKYISVFDAYFKKFDFWVCPVLSRQAFPHVKTGKDIEIDGKPYAYWRATISYTTLFNVTGLPAIVLPIGFASDGLPIGVQLVAGLGKDQQLLAFAKDVEKLLPGVDIPGGFEA